MQDWPAIIMQANKSLESIEEKSANSPAIDPSSDPTQRLFNSILSLATQNKGHKWLSNFEVAAMHLSVHLKARLRATHLKSTKYVAIGSLGCNWLSNGDRHTEAGANLANNLPVTHIVLQPGPADQRFESKANELSAESTQHSPCSLAHCTPSGQDALEYFRQWHFHS
jgi:hypothetical protein